MEADQREDGPVVLGIEGTAWAASAAVYDEGAEDLTIETEAYEPEGGGIHPREAAEHMHEAVPAVVERVLDATDEPIDCVAFSRGPGLGPCLRIVGTAARSLSGTLEVPLVGVNHMVAHLEAGRRLSGFSDPICLNASGANAHVLAYRNGRYRVLGETMDTGIGNAIDKFSRHLGWSHPGGPKVEAAALDGDPIELPYVVKGMDFSFAGITSAAKAAVDEGAAVADVCAGLQETVFAMLTEVSERALSLSGAGALVLGGGVGRNDRLQAMLGEMCEARGADFFAPEDRLLGDNAGMIAMLGATMYAADDTVAIGESGVRPEFRPDEVPVTWRSDAGRPPPSGDGDAIVGAEATVEFHGDRVLKRRTPRGYRHPALDRRLRRQRTRLEARLTSEARRVGVPTPVVLDVDPVEARIAFEYVGTRELGADLSPEAVRTVGGHLARLHAAGIVHGDPTTRNARVAPEEGRDGRVYLIDFGLGYHSDDVEDHAMDLHVFHGSLAGVADDPGPLAEAVQEGYRAAGSEAALEQLEEIEGRGRYH